ncbi:MAG: hypothetical protein FWC40_08605 [Proteobacteria bacterium]|nr:hypothetical protein [Pseudomonadota bacterium]
MAEYATAFFVGGKFSIPLLFVAIQPNATSDVEGETRPTFDPYFRVRSMIITHWGSQHCTPNSSNYDFGRCLPIHTLPTSIYETDPLLDRDGDGLNDELENALAEAFRPIAVNHSNESATRVNVYTTVTGNSVSEPVVAFQVRQSSVHEGAIDIVYMKLWREDNDGCDPHQGDTQRTNIVLKTPVGTSDAGKIWWLYSTYDAPASARASSEDHGEMVEDDEVWHSESSKDRQLRELQELLDLGIVYDLHDDSDLIAYEASSRIELSASEKDADKEINIDSTRMSTRRTQREFRWQQGDTHLRKPHFERLATDLTSIIPKHFVIYFTKGKHHEYQDGRYSGLPDIYCNRLPRPPARIDSRGELRILPLPKRPLELRSPAGKGDLWDYNNVGSRDKFSGFMDALDDFGFAGRRSN